MTIYVRPETETYCGGIGLPRDRKILTGNTQFWFAYTKLYTGKGATFFDITNLLDEIFE